MSNELAKAVKVHPAFRPTGSTRPPSEDGPMLSIAGGDDLLAAALAAVDARRSNRSPEPVSPDPRAAEPSRATTPIEFDLDDLVVDPEGDGLTDGDIVVGLERDGSDGPEAIQGLLAELAEGRAELAQARVRIEALEASLQAEIGERKRAGAILLRANDRIQRAEHAARLAQDARAAAEDAAKNAREALERSMADVKRLNDRRKSEVEEARRFAASPLLLELFPVQDNLQMALQHASSDAARVLQGVQMIAEQLRRTIERTGAQRILATPGTPFQPEFHEAMQRVPSADHPEGTIQAELSAGYTLHGRLLRAARVSVAAPALAPTPSTTPPPSPSSQVPDNMDADPAGSALP